MNRCGGWVRTVLPRGVRLGQRGGVLPPGTGVGRVRQLWRQGAGGGPEGYLLRGGTGRRGHLLPPAPHRGPVWGVWRVLQLGVAQLSHECLDSG